MVGLDINSKVRINSGYEMPVLGYGVSTRFNTLRLDTYFMFRSIKRKMSLAWLGTLVVLINTEDPRANARLLYHML